MSILDKATLNRTGSQKRKYAKLEVFLKPTVGVEHTDMIQSIENISWSYEHFPYLPPIRGSQTGIRRRTRLHKKPCYTLFTVT